jgi:hypothetical protein
MIENCPNCGGTHIGHNRCPMIIKPCVVCGEDTGWACSDCAIDGKPGVHVCGKSECRDKHESGHTLEKGSTAGSIM